MVSVSTQAVAETSADSTPVLVEAESMPGLVAAARPAGAVTSVVSVSTQAVAGTLAD